MSVKTPGFSVLVSCLHEDVDLWRWHISHWKKNSLCALDCGEVLEYSSTLWSTGVRRVRWVRGGRTMEHECVHKCRVWFLQTSNSLFFPKVLIKSHCFVLFFNFVLNRVWFSWCRLMMLRRGDEGRGTDPQTVDESSWGETQVSNTGTHPTWAGIQGAA